MRVLATTRMLCVLVGLLVVGFMSVVPGCGDSEETTTTESTTTTTMASSSTTASADSGTTASSTTPASFTGEEATIAANWVQFFDGGLPVEDKIGLLENGDQMTDELEAQAASPIAIAATVTVSSVTITSDTTADVEYDILVGGVPALPDQTGQAVKQDGVWKVSAESFLALLALQQGSSATAP